MADRASEAGSASVWLVAGMVVVVAVAAALVGTGVAAVTRQHAAVAADAVALAVAADVLNGPVAACRVGGELATANGVQLERCVVSGAVADVDVTGRLPGRLAALGAVTVAARAGP